VAARPLRLFILAGEHSGDVLGADLVRRLQARTSVELSGVGGPELTGTGLKPMFPMSDLAVMGLMDVLPRLLLLLWRARQVANAIVTQKPDVVVLIDAQVFAAVVARRVRRSDPRIPILLYVSPTVWAWKPERASKLVGVYDEVLAILPFEPKVMAELGGPPTSYVGHPAMSRMPFRATLPEKGPLLLLPGSRRGELRRHIGTMKVVAERLSADPQITGVVIPTVAPMAEAVKADTADWPIPVEVVVGPAARDRALTEAVAACAVIGTITLELAAAGVPFAAIYIVDAYQKRHILKADIKRGALPNIILDRFAVPEVPTVAPEPDRVADIMQQVLATGQQQIAAFAEMRERMVTGLPGWPRVAVEDRVLERAGR
jgi:lipid-A-disaccharide synthase